MFELFKKKVPEGMFGDTARIMVLLQEMKDQGVAVSLQLAGFSAWYDSRVVALDPQQRLMALDRVKEERDHQRIMSAGRFTFLARCNGVISFNTELVPIVKKGKISRALKHEQSCFNAETSRYVIRVPEFIEYRARRVGSATISSMKCPISLVGIGCKVNGYLSDISRTELELRTRDPVSFQPGDEIASCTFELLGVSVFCRLRITHKQLDTTSHETRLKGVILDISQSQLWKFDQALAQLSGEQKSE